VSEDLATAVKSYAIEELGFDLVGITDARPPAGGHRLAGWIAAGAHGEMGWMAETAPVRADPDRFLAGARSVVCVALSYHEAPEAPELAPAGERVVVARYARRKDYHDVIKPRLVRLGRFLAARSRGSRWRTAVDTAPVLERELAQRAGLGWIGKNTCLINTALGSEIFLGELFTTVELPPDQPETDHCGTCTACLDACPTRAITAPGELDARRCISYLTIEHRSQVPAALAPSVGAHLAGCDICQAVCPWNRRARPRTLALLEPRPHLARLTLSHLESLDEQGFRNLARGTPLRRLDHRRFLRNVSLLQANLGRSLTIPRKRNIKRPSEGTTRPPGEV
jgi:epoxyqueuosine reductase